MTFYEKKGRKTLKNGICNILKQILNNFEMENQWPYLHSLFDTHGLSPQTVKGYRTCLGSVLNRTGKAPVVQHKTISDMIASMELQRPPFYTVGFRNCVRHL